MPKPRLSYYSFDSVGNPWVSGGGAQRDAQVLSRFSRNWEVTLYVGRYPGFRIAPIEGVRIRPLGFGGSNAMCRLAFSLLANLRILFDSADAIGNSLSAFAPLPAALLRRKRCYAVLHHKVGGEAVKKYGWAGFLPRGLESLMLRGLRHFIVSNRATAEKIRAVNPQGNILVTSNSIDGALLESVPREADPPYILFLGRFDIHMKGIDILLEAYARATAGASPTTATAAPAPDKRLGHALESGSRPEPGALPESGSLPKPGASLRPDLILAGAASLPAQESVRALIPAALSARVRLRPNITEAEKRNLLSECLFFCGPSRFEGFGIAALEANASGKAALVTDADGFRDSVKAPETAMMVSCGDAEELAQGLAALTRDAGRRAAMGAAGREWARGFSWAAVAEKEMLFVSAMLDRGKNRHP